MRDKKLTQEQLEQIKSYILDNPLATEREIAKLFNLSNATAHRYIKLIKEGLGAEIERIVLNPKLEMSNVMKLFDKLRDDTIERLEELQSQEKKDINKITSLTYLIKDIEKDKQELLMKWGFQPNKAFESIEKISKIIYEVVSDKGNREKD